MIVMITTTAIRSHLLRLIPAVEIVGNRTAAEVPVKILTAIATKFLRIVGVLSSMATKMAIVQLMSDPPLTMTAIMTPAKRDLKLITMDIVVGGPMQSISAASILPASAEHSVANMCRSTMKPMRKATKKASEDAKI
jgi:hypothetical protein